MSQIKAKNMEFLKKNKKFLYFFFSFFPLFQLSSPPPQLNKVSKEIEKRIKFFLLQIKSEK